MPSQPLDSGWNFSSVFDLIDSDPHDVGSPTLRPETRSPTAISEGGIQLGNFIKLYETLGYPTDATAPSLPPLDEPGLSNTDDALLPSPVLKAIQAPLRQTDAQTLLLHTPTIPSTTGQTEAPSGLTKAQRRKARKLAEAERREQIVKEQEQDNRSKESLKVLTGLSTGNAVTKPDTPSKPLRAQSNVGAKIRPTSPIPATITPPPNTIQLPQTPIPAPRPALSKRSKFSAPPVTPKPQETIQPAPPPTQYMPVVLPPLCQQPYTQYLLSHLQPPQVTVPVSNGLVPRSVRPVTLSHHSHASIMQPRWPTTPSPVPFPSIHTPLASQPTITIRSQVDRHFHLFQKLLNRFTDDTKWLVSPRQLVNENTRAEGIHVFVDASNIMIGFKDMLRYKRIQSYDISFDSLALLMERRRPVARRVLVGSHREANPLPQVTKLIETCKAVGYECNVQEQVFIVRAESVKKKFFNDVNRLGWQKAIQRRSGSGSDSETGAAATPKTPSAPKWVEQGVDELLHLKMCQSLLDTEVPSTMVLATGDGAEAEMSDGFLAHVERALRLGWKVELITWKQQTNGGYKKKTFRQKWGEQFTIIELDDFLEDLIDTE